jgi:hypothetical protein
MSVGAQGAFMGDQVAATNAMPMMFDPTQYMPQSGPPSLPLLPSAAPVSAPERPPTLGYQAGPVPNNSQEMGGGGFHQPYQQAEQQQEYQQQQQQQPEEYQQQQQQQQLQQQQYHHHNQQPFNAEDPQQQMYWGDPYNQYHQQQQYPTDNQEAAGYEAYNHVQQQVHEQQVQAQPQFQQIQQQQPPPTSAEAAATPHQDPGFQNEAYSAAGQQQYQLFDAMQQQSQMNGVQVPTAAEMQPDLVAAAAAPPANDFHPEAGQPEVVAADFLPDLESRQEGSSSRFSMNQFGSGPDVISAGHVEPAVVDPAVEAVQDSQDDPETHSAGQQTTSGEPSPQHRPQQGSHAEHYAYYQQFEAQQHQQQPMVQQPPPQEFASRPPDIISTEVPVVNNVGAGPSSDRNLFMQTGHLDEQDEREPIDGGNEAVQPSQRVEETVDLPIDRLVLGESEPRPPLAPPPMMAVKAAPMMEERIITGGSDSAVVQQPPPPPTSLSISPSVPSTERSEAAGSDRREVNVPPPPVVAGPPLAVVAPPPGRNVTGSDNTNTITSTRARPAATRRLQESDDEDESVFSRESEKRKNHRSRNKDGHHRKKRNNAQPVQQRSPSGSRSSSASDPQDVRGHRRGDGYREYGRRDQPRDHRRESKNNSSRRDDHNKSSRSHRDRHAGGDRSYRDQSFRDDSSRYYDDRRSDRDGNRRSHQQDSYISRPSSRSGYYNDRHYTRPSEASYYYGAPQMGYPGVAPYAAPPPDPKTLEIFRKNWEYYSRNPTEMETLRQTNPTQHTNLMRYYQMYSHLLPTTAPVDDRPPSRTSGHSTRSGVVKSSSFQHQFHDNEINEESTIFAAEDSLAMQHYQPTPEASLNYDPEVEKYTAAQDDSIVPATVSNERLTPAKFSIPHVQGVFSTANLIKIDAKSPMDGQTATLEVHSLKSLVSRQPNFKELHNFPGPLVPGHTHKGEVIQFCQNKIQEVQRRHQDMADKDSYILMWELMILLLRQKNAIDGSDIAELLLKDRDIHRPYKIKNNNTKFPPMIKEEPNDSNSNENDDDGAVRVKENRTVLSSEQEMDNYTAKFRDYLLFGHKKEGLEFAMTHGLWGHALFLASKMDERSYSQVMLRFANGLVVNDPLQTLYQLMSGRQPIAVKECADQNWGDWRPHLAMILSNAGTRSDGLDHRSILTLGDTLTERGFLWAGQFCYLMVNKEFGTFSNRNAKIVLIGADKSLPFGRFATNEAIQCTEIFEYVQKLSTPDYVLQSLQYYKFLYAIRLLDHGLPSRALHYLEELAGSIGKHPDRIEGDLMDSKEMAGQVLFLADKLKYLDPMYTTREGEVSDMGDPEWLNQYRACVDQLSMTSPSNSNQGEPVQQKQTSQEIPLQGLDQDGRLYLYDVNTNSYYYPDEQQDEQQDQLDHQKDVYVNGDVQQEEAAAAVQDEPIMMKPSETVEETSPDSRRQSVSSSVHQPSPTRTAPPPIKMMPPTVTAESQMPNYFSDMTKTISPQPAHVEKQPAAEMNHVKPPQQPPMSPGDQGGKKKKSAGNDKLGDKSAANNSGLFGRILGKLGVIPKHQAYLPEDKDNTIVWDEEKKKWVDKNAEDDETNASSTAPPSDMELSRTNSSANIMDQAPGPPQMVTNNNSLAPPPNMMGGGNKFAGGLGKKRGLVGRIDVFKNSQSSPALASGAIEPPSVGNELLMPPAGPIIPQEQLSQEAPMVQPLPQNAGGNGSPTDGPVFFNPHAFSAGGTTAGSTRRNKYA